MDSKMKTMQTNFSLDLMKQSEVRKAGDQPNRDYLLILHRVG